MCISSRNLSCPIYQNILEEFSSQFSLMDDTKRRNMVEFFILSFLRRNTTDPGCVFSANTSTEWLLMNFGPFAQFVSLRDLFSINTHFDPLETLVSLSPDQMVGLMVDDLPGLPEKNVVINRVFDHLLESPVERGLPGVLENLLSRSQMIFIPCSSYILIFTRLFQALPFLPSEMETLVVHTTGELKENGARGCSLPEHPTCLVTPVNATRVCAGVNSNELETLLSSGLMKVPCNISLEQYACSSLTGFTAENLAELLMCQLSSSNSHSKEIWKLLLTKTKDVLDQALIFFSNTSQPVSGVSVSNVLDVIGELRLEQISPDQWSDIGFISLWFGQNLRPFLPSASAPLLMCISSRNLSCPIYQNILEEFSSQFSLMDDTKRRNMVEFFILSFLRRNTTDPGCVFSANTSTEWLLMNFGPFAQFVSLRDLFSINTHFDPLETLVSLSPDQMVGLMVDDLPGLPEKNVVINRVFDHLLESPVERGLPKVLQLLTAFTVTSPLSCQSNQLIFMQLDKILRSSAGDLEPIIWASVYNFSRTAPAGCSVFPPVNEQCPLTPYNESQVCSGVDSSALQNYLNNGDTTKTLCDFSIPQYACTPVLNVSVEHLVSILECQLSTDVTSSPESWKLFLARVSHLLDSAFYTLSNRSVGWSGQSASVVLDVLRELRLDRLTDDGVVTLWFGERLRPLLLFPSRTFLQCLRSRTFSCQNFQRVVAAFNAGFLQMDQLQKEITVSEFILPFLSERTAGAACVSNDSALWLVSNFGQFSTLLSLNQLISLNPQINLLETLVYLSPEQLAGLIVGDLTGLPEKDVVIAAVFDHLTASPLRIPEFLVFLVTFSKTSNISCLSYRSIFHRLDHLTVSVPVELEILILRSKTALLQDVPPGCVSFSGVCDVTPVNETSICKNVNSSFPDGSQLCDFNITQYACAELTGLSTQDLVTMLSCSLNSNETVSEETWKLFTLKINVLLGPALDQLANMKLNKSRSSVSFLNMIGEVTLSTFSSTNLQDESFIQRWFNIRLRPFLPHASENFLSCLATRDFSCDTYRSVVEIFSQSFDVMSTDTQANVYVDFIKVFLSLNKTAGCVDVLQSSSDWLTVNFARFAVFTSISDLQMLNPNFNVLDTLSLLSVRQLVELSSTPGVLTTTAAVNQLLLNIPDNQFTGFYTSLSAALKLQGVVLAPPVREAFLQQVFVRGNLTTVSDAQLEVWIQKILPPFVQNITVQQTTQYFSIIQQRPCSISQQGVQLLNSSVSTFQPATQDQIYQQILNSLQGPTPLQCYGNQSYYSFLVSSFMSFQFPNLSTFLSLMTPARVSELLASMSPAEVSSLLNRPNAVDDVTKLCELLRNYPKTSQYLQTERVGSVGLARQVLSCVWSQVLKVNVQSEVDQWFDYRLVQYLPFLTSQLISPDVMLDTSCLSFRKFVTVMGKHNYSVTDFTQGDIYRIIQMYLNTSSAPKCYNASNPDLNSTAWFANYIGVFMSFITLDDLLRFGSSKLQPFTVNLENLQLFKQFSVPDNVTEFYMALLFQENPSFSAFYLPEKFLCLAPPSSFLQLNMTQLKIVSPSIHQTCTTIQPDVSAALASNAPVLSVDSITALNQSCTGLSTDQISLTGGAVLQNALSVLSAVIGWNQDQAMSIIQTLLSSGVYQINDMESLQRLGSLIIGISSSIINSIQNYFLLNAVKYPSFLTNVMTAPVIIQQTIVSQIISVNTASDTIITNVPDVLATEIPRIFLLGVSSSSAVTVNEKKWKPEQAMLLFETVATEISNPYDISFQVLQGFTCTRIQKFNPGKIRSLISGCQRRGNVTVVLQESQLTCMYQYIKSGDINLFSQYPADLLLYYEYSLIDRSLCRSYFSALGSADFSVLSNTLSFKTQTLFNNARDCLGISGFNISREQLHILGTMSCILSADYIQNSDPYVLEKLKQCPDLTQQQIFAIETVLLRGNTTYGSPDTWNKVTLDNLGILPLYITSNIWDKISQTDKQKFLKTFIRGLRKSDVSEMKIINMMNMVKQSSKSLRFKRATECTVGEITQVQVYSDIFPFNYDETQFNVCLSVQTLKFNLEGITDKVYDRDFQRIILNKLNQAYPDGIPDGVLQVLGSSSRAAMPDDVKKWSVTKIDTLSSLMNSRNGVWDPQMVQLIVSKYLSVNGNSLGTYELNSIRGSNLCALNISVLNNITAASVERAAALSLTNCSSEKKRTLFSIAQNAFSATNTRSTDTISTTTYQLMQSYLGGADSTFIRKLVNSNVSMDLITFIGLEQSVINTLNVVDVKSLLGVNVADLKTYESASQVQEWVKLQLQSDLDTLKIGLTGGRNSTVTNSTTKAPSSQSSTASVAGAIPTSTTAAGSRVWAPVCLQLFLLAVPVMTLQLLH
ncbi:uncharacterized protein mslnb isoform X31 [Xyrauchen texanus]|uniref:uncharacterized protein mslnb isoform X1 n=2 Tax=Xyrauchen texanus TaxID=154827 RepID=UPI002242401B|nr:uncharacterized protein mslnb isoform X1 [Xyrauchen texanus]XP_051994238.1 uncharacterized protein mslnb isoform X2 [Xyrauchen texanus]XP_051994239.1 uncharacterized protein mslnb isoform X3 [Xyrauchen texanus]XP_051994240.1 uncharacterized protein mslnb isoform X4 [Xyrauchen texanus]XP_051994241.1 uncharacterized protein mslnb isoform X5 [Xyrauchen texanus]XP_051994242.1 uncharacterized protein mslnb isoform X6 [Xyrauchen texanus]XP_051994244.1 uncharacterized protein mslnb isoform X7 [Xy